MQIDIPMGVPEEARPRFAELLEEPLVPAEELLKQVDACLGTVRHAVMQGAPLDVPLVEQIAERARQLVRRVGTDGREDRRRLVQAAVRYFVEADDAEGDLVSLMGFDDDAEVVEAVHRRLTEEG